MKGADVSKVLLEKYKIYTAGVDNVAGNVIGAQAANEEEIIIVFVNDLDASRAKKIEKLSTEGLPTSGAGITNIIWINNFWLKDDNDGDVDVPYKLQLKQKTGKVLVYHDGKTVKQYTGKITPVGNGMIEIELSLGDPGTGWGTKG